MVPLDEWWYNRFVSSVFFNNQNVRVAATQTSWSVFGHHIFDRSPNSIGISIIAGLVIFASRAADGCSSCQISLTDQYVNFDMRTWCFLKKKENRDLRSGIPNMATCLDSRWFDETVLNEIICWGMRKLPGGIISQNAVYSDTIDSQFEDGVRVWSVLRGWFCTHW